MKETITTNKKAFHDYQVIEVFEVGIKLSGAEVKSIKSGNISLKEGFVHIDKGELYLKNVHIGQYKPARIENYDPTRSRKLLIHKKEIEYLAGKTNEKGLSIVPTKVYLKNNLIKLEIALVKGKKKGDKRESIKKRDIEREMRRST